MASRGQQRQAQKQAAAAAANVQAAEIAKSQNIPDPTSSNFRFYESGAPAAESKTKVIYEEVANVADIAENPSMFEEDKSRRFKYPLSMPTSGKGYPGTILFTAIKIDGIDLSKEMKGLYNRLTRKPVLDSEVSESEQDMTPAQLQEQRNNLSGLSNQLQSYENTQSGEDVGSVLLPLQRDLRFSDNVVYESPAIGALGAGLSGAIGGKNPFEGATKGDGSFSTAASALAAQAVAKASGAGVGALIGKLAGGALGGAVLGAGATEGLGDAVKNATRIASAPNQRTLFKEVQIRQFAFAFKLIANSAAEAEEIKSIVKFFRQELYPEMLTFGDNKIPIAYKFPNVFSIDVKNQLGGNAASKIQRCYLRDVQTSYNATGNGLLQDGNFIEVDIALSFQEVKALDKLMVAREDF